MKADNELLLAVSAKLSEIAEKTTDLDTKAELDEFVDVILASL